MIVCPVCGFRNMSQSVRCLKCNALLRENEEELRRAFADADSRRESGPGLWIAGRIETLRARFPLRGLWRLPAAGAFRFPWTAGLLSLFAGFGQVYNRQFGKALLLGGLWWTYAAVCLATMRESCSNILLVGLLLAWAAVWNDALVTANRINGAAWTVRDSMATWCAGLFYVGIVATALQYFLPTLVLAALLVWVGVISALQSSEPEIWSRRAKVIVAGGAVIVSALIGLAWRSDTGRIFTFMRIAKDVTHPVIDRGDMVFTLHCAYWFRKPRLGELMIFDPDHFSMERGADVYAIDIQNYYQRVCGLAGDVVEKKGGKFYRNGRLLAEDEAPIGGEVMPEWTYRVPDGCVFAPVTRIPDDAISGLFGVGSAPAINSGVVLKGWMESTMVRADAIQGRAVAIVNPPPRRGWVGRK